MFVFVVVVVVVAVVVVVVVAVVVVVVVAASKGRENPSKLRASSQRSLNFLCSVMQTVPSVVHVSTV